MGIWVENMVHQPSFEWDENKNITNQEKHGVSFEKAQYAFDDPNRIISHDLEHSNDEEERFFCFGRVGGRVLTVRFTYRHKRIRIYGAGYWRKGKEYYERTNRLH